LKRINKQKWLNQHILRFKKLFGEIKSKTYLIFLQALVFAFDPHITQQNADCFWYKTLWRTCVIGVMNSKKTVGQNLLNTTDQLYHLFQNC
jgi:hypothetical protein